MVQLEPQLQRYLDQLRSLDRDLRAGNVQHAQVRFCSTVARQHVGQAGQTRAFFEQSWKVVDAPTD